MARKNIEQMARKNDGASANPNTSTARAPLKARTGAGCRSLAEPEGMDRGISPLRREECYTVVLHRLFPGFEKRLFLKDFCAVEKRWRRGRASHPAYWHRRVCGDGAVAVPT